MSTRSKSTDYDAFGQIVRHRRRQLGLSQEALASAALGNPDRKSFVSAIENSRLEKITPNTAQKLSGPLGLTAEDMPASLRWPTPNDPSPIEERLQALERQSAVAQVEIDDHAIARFLNKKMAATFDRSMSDLYYDRLSAGLTKLQAWTGRPFHLQSLLICYALCLTYLVISGLIGFFSGDITIGAIRPFQTWEAVSAGLQLASPLLAFLLLGLGMIGCWLLIRPFGRRRLTEGQTAARLAAVALVSGLCCGLVDYVGAKTMAAAALFAVPSVAALSTLQPRRAATYGAAGGILFGLMAAISSGLTDNGALAFLTSLSEGFIIGGIVGACAGLVSSLIAAQIPDLRPSQLAAAGGGLGIGALASLAGMLVASQFSAISEGMVGLFALSWLALPFANAALDYLSLGVSHAIGRHVVKAAPRVAALCLLCALDLALALAFMVLTVVMVGLGLNTVTWLLGIETLSSAFLQTSANDPWGAGVWLTIMALTTATWTWLHFAFAVAPLVAGLLARHLVEEPALRRGPALAHTVDFDASLGALVVLRSLVFFGSWAALAAAPIILLWQAPQLMQPVLQLGHRLAEALL